jgi:hypothetical protein
MLAAALLLSFSGCKKSGEPSGPSAAQPSKTAEASSSPDVQPSLSPSPGASPSPSDVVETPEVPISELYRENTIKADDGTVLVEYEAALPLVSGGSVDAITTINAFYKQEMDDFIFYAENELKDTAQLNYDSSKADGGSFLPCSAAENYTIQYSKNNILSISRDLNFYFGSTNVDANVKADTFDMQTGNRIVLGNVFKTGEDTFKPVLAQAVSGQIEKLGGVDAGYYDDYSQRASEYFMMENFYLTDTGVVIFYPSITVAPAMLGVCRFEIPYGELSDILADGFN